MVVGVDAHDVDVVLARPAVERVAAAPASRAYDIVFCDPPYDLPTAALESVAADLCSHGWLALDALLVLERSARDPEPQWSSPLADGWSKRYGETSLYFRHHRP